jgi:hypothetical protein
LDAVRSKELQKGAGFSTAATATKKKVSAAYVFFYFEKLFSKMLRCVLMIKKFLRSSVTKQGRKEITKTKKNNGVVVVMYVPILNNPKYQPKSKCQRLVFNFNPGQNLTPRA